MKRRFRITITPDTNRDTYFKLRIWVMHHFGHDLTESQVHFRGFLRKQYVAGIEVFDKTAKAL